MSQSALIMILDKFKSRVDNWLSNKLNRCFKLKWLRMHIILTIQSAKIYTKQAFASKEVFTAKRSTNSITRGWAFRSMNMILGQATTTVVRNPTRKSISLLMSVRILKKNYFQQLKLFKSMLSRSNPLSSKCIELLTLMVNAPRQTCCQT